MGSDQSHQLLDLPGGKGIAIGVVEAAGLFGCEIVQADELTDVEWRPTPRIVDQLVWVERCDQHQVHSFEQLFIRSVVVPGPEHAKETRAETGVDQPIYLVHRQCQWLRPE